MEINKYMTINV